MSLRLCATVGLRDAAPGPEREDVCRQLAGCAIALPEVEAAHAGLHLEGSLGAGDLTWDLCLERGDSEAALALLRARCGRRGSAALAELGLGAAPELANSIVHLECWIVEPLAAHVGDAPVAIKRTNFVTVRRGAAPAAVGEWIRDLTRLPDHVPAIRNWSLSRVRPLFDEGARFRWTHAWEQEFESVAGLLEDYMGSAYHWGFLDGWYDLEVPKCIIEPELAHLFCPASESVLAWTHGRS